jgi:plasmid maintenance system antidote protein VapI
MKQPKNPFHPGEILLEEFLKPAGMTQMAFAKKNRLDTHPCE